MRSPSDHTAPTTGRLRLPAGTVAPLISDDSDALPLDLREVDLREANLVGADLRDADMSRCRLSLADLTGANLRGARLVDADLTLADLSGADLRAADLSGADLSGADLRDANLQDADLSGAELAFARIVGVRNGPPQWQTIATREGRVCGTETEQGDPRMAMRAFRRGRIAHGSGRLGEAEMHYKEVLAWVPTSDAARYGLACTSLDRHDPKRALHWLREALSLNDDADRARLEAAILLLGEGDKAAAADLLRRTPTSSQRAHAPAQQAATAIENDDSKAAVDALTAVLNDAPALRWYHRRPDTKRTRDVPGTAVQLADESWVQEQRAALNEQVRGEDQPSWVWHGVIAQAITIGAMDVAAHAEQRLTRTAPEHRLWGLQLRQLDLTAEAFQALVRTRNVNAGGIRSVRWVAIGAHGPTARIDCEGGVFYGKRYIGQTRPPASVAFTHRVMRALAERGINTPTAIPDRQGDDVLLFSGDLLALYPDMTGVSVADDDITPDEAATLGAELAQVHIVGSDLLTSGRPVAGLRIGTRVLRHTHPDASFERIIASDRNMAMQFEHHQMKSRIVSLLRAAGRRLAAVSAHCPSTVVHGDFGPGNVLFDSDGRAAIIDWDLADIDLAAWDLARAIDRVAIRWQEDFGTPTEVRGNVLRALVAGYEQVRPLSSFERSALPVLTAASRIDLDCSVLAVCGPVEPDIIDPVLSRCINRLSRAAAGCPEVAMHLLD